MADLLEVSSPAQGEVMVRWRYRNTGKNPMGFPDLSNIIGRTQILDPAARRVYGALMDEDRNVVGSSTIGTTIKSGRRIAPGESQTHWVKAQLPASASSALSIVVPGAVPFEPVTIGAAPSVKPLAAPRPAIASQDAEAEGVTVEVIEARRQAGNNLNVVFRYINNGVAKFGFDDLSNQLKKAYIIDSARKKYEVAQDVEHDVIAASTVEFGSIPSGIKVPPGSSSHFWAKFPAPPASVKQITLMLPGVPPIAVELSGTGGGSAAEGTQLTSSATGLADALRDLGAKETPSEITIELSADVLFDFDKADIKKEAEPSLKNVATVIAGNPGATVTITGHTDAKGADAYNQTLSERRAVAVKGWLESSGQVSGVTIATRGVGRTQPVAPNTRPNGSDDPEGRAKNRRVQIVITKARS